MKKKLLCIAVVMCLIISVLPGCSVKKTGYQQEAYTIIKAENNQTNGLKFNKVYTMQIAHAQSIDSPCHSSLEVFKKLVEDKTAGGIIVEIYPEGQLGTEKEMLDEACEGVIQSFWGDEFDLFPKLSIFSLPFLCDNEEEVNRLLSSNFAKEICENSQKWGVIVLGIGDGGSFHQFSNNERMIRKPEDLVGLKMRTNGVETIDWTFEALGATTVFVPYNDLYMGLKTDVVDGQEGSWINVSGMKLYEIQKYFTEVNYQILPDLFYVNLKWHNSLPKEYQEILRDCADKMMEINNQMVVEDQKAALEVIKANAQVYQLTSQERRVFKLATEVVYENYLKSGLMTEQELDTMRDIIKGQ
jgi:C4-dicarboxylate-binding protein DctP